MIFRIKKNVKSVSRINKRKGFPVLLLKHNEWIIQQCT